MSDLTARDEVEVTVWRILRQHTVGVLAKDVDPADEPTVSMVIEPHAARMQHTLAMLMLCYDQSVAAHLSTLQSALHTQTGLEDDLIDEAIEAASHWADEPVDI